MKKGSFTGLLYREFYLGKSTYITGILLFAGSALLGWLSILSLKYGNFGSLFGKDLSGGVIKNKEASEIIGAMILLFMRYIPAFMSCTIGAGVFMDVACKDVMNKWNRFEHSTPVTPLRFAAVKTISMLITTTISFILAVFYIFTIDIGLGESFTYAEISIISIFLLFLVVLGVLSQIFIMLLKDRDKGMLCTTAIVMAPIFIISFINSKNERESGKEVSFQETIKDFTEKTLEYCPLIFLAIAVIFAVLFVSMYLIYKRREK